jgi:REP element-mobilizing transposase RayT
MSDKYKIFDNYSPYFFTMTTVGWIDIFTRKELKLLIVDSLKHCQKNKGLIIYSWCLMPSHLHLICGTENDYSLSDVLRDFKKFTSKAIVRAIHEIGESRKEWLLEMFQKYCEHLKREQQYKVWQDGNQAKIIFSPDFFYEKLNYIHNNPVEDMIVQNPEDYLFSSARNYADMEYLLDVVVESSPLITVR